ncbi:glycine/betaine ABC transporter substrate-binding protein [Candidatus Micrarchaeota archaeon]|nr:glycine/betaine ABC transporter substrate-binding protein [Candidatus Micrarchaeota archaeon]
MTKKHESNWLVFALLLAVFSVVLVSGCVQESGEEVSEPQNVSEQEEEEESEVSAPSEPIDFGLPPWPGVTVKTEVVRQILVSEGYKAESHELDAGIVYAQLAEGDLDVLLAGWLPVTHKDYWNKHGDKLEQVAVNVNETWLGVAVPTYTYEKNITSLEDLKGNGGMFGNRIVGIEPGAGISQSTLEAIDAYELSNYTLATSSTPAMMAEVDAAVDGNEDIAFTIWEPHSAFARFDIKKLEDPKQIYGGGDVVKTIARKDFKDDYPKVYDFLKEFEVSPQTQSEWILEYSDNGRDPSDIAAEWIADNPDKVDDWKESLN